MFPAGTGLRCPTCGFLPMRTLFRTNCGVARNPPWPVSDSLVRPIPTPLSPLNMPILYTAGDATRPVAEGAKIICHVCNDIGGWGAGFVVALSRRWPEPERAYRDWHGGRRPDDMTFALGAVQFVGVQPDITVANMIGQHGVARRGRAGVPPIRYESIRQALQLVADHTAIHQASVHMPRIGAGLAGGDWTTIEQIIEDELCGRSVPVTVYDLPPQRAL